MNQNPAATGLILRLEVRTHLCPRQHALRQRQHLPRILRGCSLQAEVPMLVSNSMILKGNLILSLMRVLSNMLRQINASLPGFK